MVRNRAALPTSASWERRQAVSRAGLVAVLTGSGILHLLAPAPYRRIVPSPLAFGHTSEIVLISGLAELACAAAIVGRRTRRAGAWVTAALFVAVFPANVKMALDAGLPEGGMRLAVVFAAWLRLPLQVPLILWALSVRKRTAARDTGNLRSS